MGHPVYAGVFAFRTFLNTLLPVFQNNNFLVIYSVIHYQDSYFSEILVLKYLKKKPETQTPLYMDKINVVL